MTDWTHRVTVQNVVCNAYLGSEVDLQDVCELLHGRLDERVFPAVVSIVRESKDVSVSIFKSGQLVISGARSYAQAAHAAYLVVEKLNSAMWRTDLRVYNFAIQNLVGSADLGFLLNLPAMAVYDKPNLNHEPETFEGLHWRTTEPNIGFVLFGSGKAVATGMKQFSQLLIAEERLRQLNKYRLHHEQLPESVLEAARNNIRFDKKKPAAALPQRQQFVHRRRDAAEKKYQLTLQQRRQMEYTQAEKAVPFGSPESQYHQLVKRSMVVRGVYTRQLLRMQPELPSEVVKWIITFLLLPEKFCTASLLVSFDDLKIV